MSRLAVMLALALSVLPAVAVAGGRERPAMVDTINRARAKNGAHALRHSETLSRSAKRYARHLLRTGNFGHRGRIRSGKRFTYLGELLARHRGRKPRPSRTVRGWLHSPAHRPVLLGNQFRAVGVGRALGRRRTIWVVHLGGR
jgi:uncharacterized protein YkwD